MDGNRNQGCRQKNHHNPLHGNLGTARQPWNTLFLAIKERLFTMDLFVVYPTQFWITITLQVFRASRKENRLRLFPNEKVFLSFLFFSFFVRFVSFFFSLAYVDRWRLKLERLIESSADPFLYSVFILSLLSDIKFHDSASSGKSLFLNFLSKIGAWFPPL